MTKSSFAHLELPGERVVAYRPAPDLNGAGFFQSIRDLFSKNPPLTMCAAIFDLRKSSGFWFDDDITSHYQMVYALREANGFDPNFRARFALLVAQSRHAAAVSQQFGALRHSEVASVYSAAAAWHHVAPGRALPEALANFLK